MAKQDGDDLASHCAALMSSCLTRADVSERSASEIVFDVMAELRKVFGGQNIYFPRGRSTETDERSASVYARWHGGMAIDAIASADGITLQWAYRLLARERRRLAEVDKAARRAKTTKHLMEKTNA